MAIIVIITKASVSSLESSCFSTYSGAPQGHHVIFPAKGPPLPPPPYISLLYIIYQYIIVASSLGRTMPRHDDDSPSATHLFPSFFLLPRSLSSSTPGLKFIHGHTHTYIYIYIHMCIYIYRHTHILCLLSWRCGHVQSYVYVDRHAHAHMYAYIALWIESITSMNAYIHLQYMLVYKVFICLFVCLTVCLSVLPNLPINAYIRGL